MSHFAVLVIGDNPEKQLAPYHEFECTGYDDEYVQDIDITQEVLSYIDTENDLNDALSYYGLEDRIIEDESQIDKSETHKYGYAIVKDGQLIKAVDRTNPNKKWDWYVLGGRFSNLLRLKNGCRANQAKKSYIDYQTSKLEASKQAKHEYSVFKKFMAEHGNEFPKTLSELRAEHVGEIDIAREKYRSQPIVEAIDNYEALKPFIPFLGCPFDYFGKSEDEFVKRETESTGVTYAIIKDGKWCAKGEMGWFGCSSDDMTQEQWNTNYWKLIESLPDETLISVYDCHI